MRRSPVAGIGALALLLASTVPAVAQEADPAPDAAVWSALANPIEGTLTGEHSVNPEAPDCPPGSSWRFDSSGSGSITDLGDVDFVLTQCTVFDPEAGAGTFGHGTLTLTTAEGDTLVLAQAGHAGGVPGAEGLIGWTMGGHWDVASGTGQFEGVSGHGWIGGLGDIPGDADFRFEGYLDDGTAE
jgi:hypothetical protein